MAATNSQADDEPKLGRILREDLRRGDLKRTLSRDLKELREFYLDEGRKKRLASMGWLKRLIYMAAWLLKSLFLKLTPLRRVLVVMSLFLILISRTVISSDNGVQTNNLGIVGGVLLLFILMLELKDKLLARSELEAGRAVQNALMPERKPSLPGWALWLFARPANDVGGDFVDYMEVGENRFGIALGDVTGKGLRAALLMAKLQATLRALAPDFKSLAELGAKINEIFHRDSIPSIFASLVYLELQSDSGLIRFLNAGHLPPIALRSGRIVETLKGAPALGILAKATYSEQHIELEAGDSLLVYSDGVTDAETNKVIFSGASDCLDSCRNWRFFLLKRWERNCLRKSTSSSARRKPPTTFLLLSLSARASKSVLTTATSCSQCEAFLFSTKIQFKDAYPEGFSGCLGVSLSWTTRFVSLNILTRIENRFLALKS